MKHIIVGFITKCGK